MVHLIRIKEGGMVQLCDLKSPWPSSKSPDRIFGIFRNLGIRPLLILPDLWSPDVSPIRLRMTSVVPKRPT
ncbi:hypothetical protein CEXT_153421 [Caerostris extrusa]|uniref:Uncharacterized protein n=1 Tax=Caerostris extrusa TaxID=172846 RepID=A0AAV4UYW1_CAEEX|nr:hypothetical protein CEXT_153421 [Caerostris extrusa]